MTVGFGYLASINGLDEILGCESLPLSHVCSIKDGALRFCHIARAEEASCDHVCLIGNRCLRCGNASSEVHQAYLISVVITL